MFCSIKLIFLTLIIELRQSKPDRINTEVTCSSSVAASLVVSTISHCIQYICCKVFNRHEHYLTQSSKRENRTTRHTTTASGSRVRHPNVKNKLNVRLLSDLIFFAYFFSSRKKSMEENNVYWKKSESFTAFSTFITTL